MYFSEKNHISLKGEKGDIFSACLGKLLSENLRPHSSTFTHTPHLKASMLLPSDSFESLNTSCVARVEVHTHSISNENTNRHQLKLRYIHETPDCGYIVIHYPP